MLHNRIINKPEITEIRDFNKSFYLSNGGCDFKFLKKFLRSYKNDFYFTEYVFIVDALKGFKILGYSENIFKLMNTDLKDERTPYFYEYKLKNIVYNKLKDEDLKLINYLERYLNICIKYHYDKLLEYQKKLNTDYFKELFSSSKETILILNNWIEFINNEIQFGSGRNILFYWFDIDSPNRSIFLIPLEFKKEFFENELQLLKSKIKDKIEPKAIDLDDAITNNKIKDYKSTIWFRTGVTLATGVAYDLYNRYKLDKGHFTKICLELGFKDSDRPYFSDTINDNNGDKNTFANKDKLIKLHNYLTENNLSFGSCFLEKYNQIVSE